MVTAIDQTWRISCCVNFGRSSVFPTLSECVIHAVIIRAFCHGNQLNQSGSLKNVNWIHWTISFRYWNTFSVWSMADSDTNTGGVPKGLRLVVRFWGAVSGLCEYCVWIFDLSWTSGFFSKYGDLILLFEQVEVIGLNWYYGFFYL